MKRILVILILILCIVLSFFLLSNMWVCNSIDTEYLCIHEEDGKLYAKLQYSTVYSIDLESKSFSLVEKGQDRFSWLEQNDPSAFKLSLFAGEYVYTIPTVYEGVVPHIVKCELDEEGSIVDACGYETDGVLFGFLRVYKDTRGVYGNYSIEEIDHSLIFTYNAETDKFNVEHLIDNVVIVAIHEDAIIYWKDKAYYRYLLNSKEETYLVEDKAYDSGLTQSSTTGVYFNSKLCIIHMTHGTISEDKDYLYIYDWSSGEFSQLTEE